MGDTVDIKLLVLGSGPAMPSRNVSYRGMFEAFSKYFTGDIVTHASSDELTVKKISRFNFFPYWYRRGNPVVRNFLFYLKVVTKAYQILLKNKSYTNVIISPDPLGTGIAAVFLKKLTGAKLIVEVNGCFDQAVTTYLQIDERVSFMTRFKEKMTRKIVPFVLRRADKVKLLYPGQLAPVFPNPEEIDAVPFHVYMPLQSFVEHEKRDDKFILLVGHPWYLKGVDILIKAFLKISPEFPEHRMVVAGWCPDPKEKSYFTDLGQGNPKIELLDPLKYEDVIRYMTSCSVYVSASRTEAMGRVIVEAMASRKPVIAANVDGIPHIVKHGMNGLLFEKESVDDLAEKLKEVLSNPELAEHLASNAYEYCQANLSGEQYLEMYKRMILSTVDE